MLFIGGGRVFHLKEGGAGQFGAVSAVVISALVHRTVVQRTYFRRHHLNGPEGGAFDVAATGACFVVEFAFIAFESAGAQYHGFVVFMQFTQISAAGALIDPTNIHQGMSCSLLSLR